MVSDVLMRLKILTFTSLYPNSQQPSHGVFVENRLRRLIETGEVDLEVVAPVPWFPLTGSIFGQYGKFAGVPVEEERHGIRIHHPRYLVLPKIGMNFTPWSMTQFAKRAVVDVVKRAGPIDLIDAHYFYPDGVAATRLGELLDIPVVITGRGTDLNLIPNFTGPRQKIQTTIDKAAAMITVCAALKESLVDLGAPESKVTVLRNGVDLKVFTPGDREASRRSFNVDGSIIASVGLLIERKGHNLIIEALEHLPDVTLLIAGDGPLKSQLLSLASKCGVQNRVKFLGNLPHEKLVDVYRAADALVLASSREGWANVLLESMACGTAVAATNIWGTPEVVANEAAGLLIPERTKTSIAETVRTLLSHLPDRELTRSYAEQFSWDETTKGQLELFESVVARSV